MNTKAGPLSKLLTATVNCILALISNVFSCAALGYMIDRSLHSDPWGIGVGALIGWILGIYWAYRQIMNVIDECNKANSDVSLGGKQ